MISSDAIRKAGPYVGNSIVTVFAFAFKTFSAADLSVTLLTTATGVQQLLVLNTDYTVVLNADQNANPGGTVTTIGAISPIANTKTLTISGNVMADTQSTDLITPGPWNPDIVEVMVDRAMIGIQQLRDRAIKFPVIDAVAPVDLPQAETRAGRLLGFDAVGAITTYIVQAATSLIDLAAATGSSLIGFIQAGVGAIVRTLQAKLREAVSVKDFGVIGDGVADDAAAFATAFASGNKLFRAPADKYKLTSAVTVPVDVSFYGDGIGKTNFVQATANTSGFLTSASANRAYQSWGGFTITGAGIGANTSIGVGFGASALTKFDNYCKAYDIEVSGFGSGMIVTNNIEGKFSDIHCHSNGTVGFKAVGSALPGSNAFNKFDYIECYDNTTDFMLDIGNENQLKRLYCWSNAAQTVLHNLWVRDSSFNHFEDYHIEPLAGAIQTGAEVLFESTAGNINGNMVGNKIDRAHWWRNGGTVDKLQLGTGGGGQAVFGTEINIIDFIPVTGGTYHVNLLNEQSTNILRPRSRSATFSQIIRELTINNPNVATNHSYIGSYYEDSYGTWAPVLFASVAAAALGTLTGTTKWQRRGNTVKVQFDVTLSAKNANTGNITFRGCETISPNAGTP